MIARTINLLCCDYSVFYLMIYSNDEYILTPTRVPYSIVCYINIDLILDHNDPLKPTHRLTNGPEPSKTIESNGSKIQKPLKNH